MFKSISIHGDGNATANDNIVVNNSRSKQPKGPNVTVQPIHFEDLGGGGFERLCFAHVFHVLKDYDVQWLGQVGSDGGRDIWAQKDGDSQCFQCANYKRFSFAKVKRDINEVINGKSVPQKFVLVWAGTISPKARTKIDSYAREKGIKTVEILSGAEFEERLRRDTKDLIPRFFEGDVFPEIKALNLQFTNPSGLSVIPKKVYDYQSDHIPRIVYEANANAVSRNHELIEVCETKNRVLLLSSGGMGKTSELEYLARHYSDPSSAFYPIMVRLNYYTGEDLEDLISKEYEPWKSVDPEKLVLIFDGLDEVHVDVFEFVIKKIMLFSHNDKYQRRKIIISCRDNFFKTDFERTHNGKERYFIIRLRELDFPAIKKHIIKVLGVSRGDMFLQALKAKGVYEIASSPFFLKYLLVLYQENNILPSSKVELFERLIETRIQRDNERSSTVGLKLDKKTVLIRREIERMALIMEINGKNYISEREFQLIVPDVETTRALIEHSFLFDRTSVGKWQFEHNNFQEYLAASRLKNESLDRIKNLIGIPPDFVRVKPSWVNALSFLFILIPEESYLFNELLDWLLGSDKELILRFERERVNLKLRQGLFKEILLEYQEKGIRTQSDKFDLRSLARFVSDSDETLNFVMKRLTEAKEPQIISELLVILSEFDDVHKKRSSIEPILNGFVMNADANEIVRYYSIHALAVLNWQRKDFLHEILDLADLPNSQYDRAGVYRYLLNSPFLEDNLELIFQMIRYKKPPRAYVNEYPSRNNVDLGDENIYRDDCLEAIKSPEGILQVLSYFSSTIAADDDDFLVRRHLPHILAVSQLLPLDQRIFDSILQMFVNLTSLHRNEYSVFFADYFERTDTVQTACSILFGNIGDEKVDVALASIADEKFVLFMVDEFKAGRLSDEKVSGILDNLLYLKPHSRHDLFYDEINKASENRFKYTDRPDWNQIQKDRYQRDLDLILDKDLFLDNVREVYNLEKTISLDKKHIIDFRRVYMREVENLYDNNIVIDTLNRVFAKPILLDEIIEKYSDPQEWEWFQITSLLKYHLENLVNLGEREKQFLKSWCDATLEKADLKGNYQWLEIYLAYFIWQFDFAYPHRVYLDLLWVYGNQLPMKRVHNVREQDQEKLPDWLERKVGRGPMMERVIRNIQEGISIPSVFRHHVSLAKKFNVKEIVKLLPKYFAHKMLDSYFLVATLEDFLDLGGDVTVVEPFLVDEKITGHDKSNLIDLLIKFKSERVKEFLLDRLNEKGNDEARLTYAKQLMLAGQVEGLLYYKDWVSVHRTFDDWIDDRYFYVIERDKVLPVLIQLLEIYLAPGFDQERLNTQDRDLMTAIVQIASTSLSRYSFVRGKLYELIDMFQVQFLHYHIAKLDDLHRSTFINAQSLDQIIEMVDSKID